MFAAMFEQAELRGTPMGPNCPPSAKATAKFSPGIAILRILAAFLVMGGPPAAFIAAVAFMAFFMAFVAGFAGIAFITFVAFIAFIATIADSRDGRAQDRISSQRN